MFSFLSYLLKLINRGRNNDLASGNTTKSLRKSLDNSNQDAITDGEENGIIESGEDSSQESRKLVARVLDLLTIVVSFFESMLVFLAAMTWGMYLLIALLIVAIIIIVLSLIGISSQAGKTASSSFGYNPQNVHPATGNSTGHLAWTDTQLSSAGVTLTSYEKNLYRLGILANKALNSYGGSFLNIPSVTNDEKIKMLIGIASTETGMQFYKPGENYNITKVPSDISENSLGYGFLGLSMYDTLQKEGLSGSYISLLKESYPTPSPAPLSDARFAPWGMAMVAAHENHKYQNDVAPHAGAVIKQVANAFGIKSNLAQFTTFVDFFLTQAQYNGAYVSDYKDYVSFYAALFVATSSSDANRSFYGWTLAPSGSDFAESGIRVSMDGKEGGSGFSFSPLRPSTPDSLTGTGSLKLYLNGKALNEPVWKYVWDTVEKGSYSSSAKSDLRSAWLKATSFSASNNTMLLNYYYGFNSFLEGNRIEAILAKKMGILVSNSSGFRATPGQGQAVINGNETTMQYLNKWKSSSSGSSTLYNYIVNTLKPTWGTSSYLTDSSDPARIGGDIAGSHASGYVDKIHGVPFYGQNGYGVNYNESYSNLHWYPGIPDTFAQTGCMTYASAYIASALTGKLINPSEMDSIMLTTGAIVKQGVVMSEMPYTYSLLGLQSKLIQGGSSAWGSSTQSHAVGYDIASTVKAGGIAFVFTDKHPFTTGTHFIAITAVERKNGIDEYSIYSSPRFDQSEVPWSKSVLLNAEVKSEPVLLVWK